VTLLATPIVCWTVNNASFFTNFEDPTYCTLLKVEDFNSSYPADYNVGFLAGTADTVHTSVTFTNLFSAWVYIVIESTGASAVNYPVYLQGI
jgi:hypothetical protein